MSGGTLIDNDVVLKSCRYGIVSELVSCVERVAPPPTTLAVSRFVLVSRILRDQKVANRELAKAQLEVFFKYSTFVDPNDAEIQFAAELEQRASDTGLNLDTGESQLLAILIRRCAAALLTGDKRAILAMGQLIADEVCARQRIACYEQVIVAISEVLELEVLRKRICSDPLADKALAISFSCSAETFSEPSVADGLRSYIEDVRRTAQTLLIVPASFLAMVP